MSSSIENIMKNVIETAKNTESPAVLLAGAHLVGFSADQSATKDELHGLLGRKLEVKAITYYVSHVGAPGQYSIRGFRVRFSRIRPDTVSVDRCKQGTCTH